MMCTNGSTTDTNAELHKAERIVNTAFIFGLGECGQLPRHMCSNVDYIQEEPAAIDILPNNVDEVICGSMHTIIKTKDDKLFSFGCNDMGVLGRVTKDSSNPKEAEDFPNIINFDFPDKIKKITCGDNHTAVLLQNGKVYITGGFRDNGGVLGIPSFKKDNEVISNTFHFLEVKFSFSVTPASSSADTSISPINNDVSVLQNGDIAARGSEFKNEFVIITDIASGEDHLICVDASKEYIYTIGNSDSCQVLNKFYDSEESETYRYKYLFPKCYHYNKDLSFETKIEKIFCGGNNTFVQVYSKEVYAIGRNAYGSCGVSSNENVIKQFQKIPSLSNKEIKQLCGGQTFTVCLLANNDLYIWGNREMLMGELEEDAYEPIQLNFFKNKNIRIKHVSCGTDHCLVLAEDGKLYAWGYGGNCFNLQKAVGALESKIPMEIKYLDYFKEIMENPKVDTQHFLNSIKIESLSGGSAHCTFILSHLDARHHLLKRPRESVELEKETVTSEFTQKGNEDEEPDAVLGKRAKYQTEYSYDQVNQDFEVEGRTKEEERSGVLSDHKKITTSDEMMAESVQDKEKDERGTSKIALEEEEEEEEEEVFSEKEKKIFNGVGVVKSVAKEDVSRGSETEDHMRAKNVSSSPAVNNSKSEALKIEELQGEGRGEEEEEEEEERSAVEEAYLKSEEDLGTDVDAGTEEKGELFHSAYSEVEQRSPTVSQGKYASVEKEKQKEEELMSDFSKREEAQEGKAEGEGDIKGESVKRTKSARSKSVVNTESPVRKQPRRSCKENIVTLNENEIVKQYQHVEQIISKKSSSYKYRKTKSATINKKENSKSKRKSAGRATVSAGAGRSKKKVAAHPVNEEKVKEEATRKKGKTTKEKEVMEEIAEEDEEKEEEEEEEETENVGEEKEEDEKEQKKLLVKGKKKENKSKVKKENAETEQKGSEQKKTKKNEKEKEKGKDYGKEKEKDKDKQKDKEKDKEKGKKKERKSKTLKEEVPIENEEDKEDEEQVNEPEKNKAKKRKRESKKKESFSRENLKRESFSAAEEKVTKSKSSKFKH